MLGQRVILFLGCHPFKCIVDEVKLVLQTLGVLSPQTDIAGLSNLELTLVLLGPHILFKPVQKQIKCH